MARSRQTSQSFPLKLPSRETWSVAGIWSGQLRSKVVEPGVGGRQASGDTKGGAPPGLDHSDEATVARVSAYSHDR
ncbi:hypothetical protein NL676_033021 [Syzygium grande]|nr:hypothetical protein NL676_033021 [Syzygium grande]